MYEIDEKITFDEITERYEFLSFNSISKITNYNEIKIIINSEDAFTHPSESYLQIEGRLLKANSASYADGDLVTLVNNAMMYMFTSIKYEL